MSSARRVRQESPGTETAAGLCLLWGQTPEGTDQALAACELLTLQNNSLIWLVLPRTLCFDWWLLTEGTGLRQQLKKLLVPSAQVLKGRPLFRKLWRLSETIPL